MQTVIKRVDSAFRVRAVIGADRHGIEIGLVVYQLLVARIAVDTLKPVCAEKLLSLSGYKVSARNNLYVVELKIAVEMRIRNSAGTDDTYAKFFILVHFDISPL